MVLHGSPTQTWIDHLAVEAINYVRETLDAPLGLRPVKIAALPYFLQDRYLFLEGDLLTRRCLFAVPTDEELDTPAQMAKHLVQLEKATDAAVILLLPNITAYNRKRLILQRVSFIVPGSQLFLPELAIDLRDHYRAQRLRVPQIETFSPTAQMLILSATLDGHINGLNAATIAAELDVSAMSISRAMEELRASDFAQIETGGRNTRLYFKRSGRALFDAAVPRLRSPVRKVRGLRRLPDSLRAQLAGESALASYTSLAEPRTTTVAIHTHQWKELASLAQGDEVELTEGPPVQVETWTYSPRVLAKDADRVDPLSLYLSLTPDDERMELAREQLLEIAFP